MVVVVVVVVTGVIIINDSNDRIAPSLVKKLVIVLLPAISNTKMYLSSVPQANSPVDSRFNALIGAVCIKNVYLKTKVELQIFKVLSSEQLAISPLLSSSRLLILLEWALIIVLIVIPTLFTNNAFPFDNPHATSLEDKVFNEYIVLFKLEL